MRIFAIPMIPNEENIRLIFGLKLNKLRHDKNLSLSELSEASGLSISYLNEIEKGKKYPKSDKILAIATALGVTYDQLVSLRMNKNLAPIGQLINSDIVKMLPLDTFGIERGKLIEMIASAPAKVSAFINTILEIARTYNFREDHFFFASLRSYQELHDNYFEDIEEAVERFCKEYSYEAKAPVNVASLQDMLSKEFNYCLEETDMGAYPKLGHFRAIFIPEQDNLLLLNKGLTENQKRFILAREIGFNYLHLDERPSTHPWLNPESFDQVLNNYKASYFAAALLIKQSELIKQLEKFHSSKKWDASALSKIMEGYGVSPETFMQRLSSILPKIFGLNQLFFIRLNTRRRNRLRSDLIKEIHLNKPTISFKDDSTVENLYRRWIAINNVSDVEPPKEGVIIKASKAHYPATNNDYFAISAIWPQRSISTDANSVTIGFVVTESAKRKIAFLDDPNIPQLETDQSFEDDIAPRSVVQRQIQIKEMQDELAKLREERAGIKA